MRLKRLYDAIENAIAAPKHVNLKERLASLRTERDIAKTAFERAANELSPHTRITAEKIDALITLMRTNALEGPILFRRALIDIIKVDDTEIQIHGRKTVLEQLVMASSPMPDCVLSFVRKWRALREAALFSQDIEK